MNLRWFAVQIDRDFLNGHFGDNKPRMYVSEDIYILL